ncbi:acetoin dehydrogenase E1 component (TPP-dependent alpha subunit) [Tepidanaerobacter acetatoxydans Re1]|uniref:Acetoin dehydrogenase E1 component (TPP-dependent alpha subunit) n=1 Tax=Tepidanaerobacter acetatoxydans (strain DSM 21804 / JCM 16047 / Re1) TaxID=1209989 RepID=F4LW54_TEPAE|nr:thiamine pyrophosphate-dependent dehydrogenase E1 component subunit alpha [Tepidanaerobacter acetatoxydans]AEE90830.1 Pyruvate dehydrogenase (acetyl-transferring) [Tepidanaerobacter acetatoxydans Re1]CCP25391.1 acetoin dehydrogenase E1 component (TPP-dependent alpha subunit) [Tepidanaerobacter acetatoxydans Re1]
MTLSKDKKLWMYRKMCEIRNFELEVDRLFKANLIWGTCHLSVGEEASAVGAVAALEKDDMITSTHRGHGHCIAKGGKLPQMFAELLGKETGYCRGRGGSMHIADLEMGNLGANGIVGGGIPIATGAALASKLKNNGKVTLCFFGDGATNQGVFHEAVNLGAVKKLPIVYLCENNLYGMSVPFEKASAAKNVADRAAAYNIPGAAVDGNDVEAVYEIVKEAVEKAREGEGPSIIEAKTYRWLGHSKSDPRVYRTREEEEAWKQKCPIKRYRQKLISEGTATEEELDEIEKSVEKIIQEALEYAQNSPEPKVEEIMDGVYA